MEFKVNMNEYVKVKLTDYGIKILKEQHETLNEKIKTRGGIGIGDFKVDIDEDGYTKFQLWSLMNHFGHTTTITSDIPFELDIIFVKDELINNS
ncbi:hypothetical protein CHH57_01800 [Niallia circulans]|uniref:Uncharacterized protein n=1 Tax=Niallia circulans TaxID=1397 RepID=A0AA91TWD5_NIACI|nr:hypothetical protein [Niallia circulans]PAD85069.1 hypothetical protein CHH57_01800 [Niallia circulans]